MMKRILFTAFIAVLCVCVNAQSEVDLRGLYFETRSQSGDVWNCPTAIHFREDGTCTYTDSRGTLECCSYIAGNGFKALHLIADTDFNGYAALTVINLRVYGYGRMDHGQGLWLHLGDFSSTGRDSKYVEMEYVEQPSAVRAPEDARKADGPMYNMEGVNIQTPDGLYIQDGKKRMKR